MYVRTSPQRYRPPDAIRVVILAYKIWTVARRSAQYLSESTLTPILRVVVESGALYSITITAALVTFVLKSNVVYVILDLVCSMDPSHIGTLYAELHTFSFTDITHHLHRILHDHRPRRALQRVRPAQ